MFVFDHLSALSMHESDQRLYGLSRVGIVLGGLWVVLKLEWSPRTPPIESCRDRSSFHQPISVFSFFLASTGAPSPSFPSSWLLQHLLSTPSPSFHFLAYAATSLLVPAADALPIFLLYFGCYEY